LTQAQLGALRHIRNMALRDRPTALAQIARALAGFGTSYHPEQLIAGVRGCGWLTLNFHPDRMLADGRTVAAALANEGIYRSQFETGISNGSRTAFAGGERDRWEEALFGGAYQTPDVRLGDRPKYGGLNLLGHPDGACPRFGSCHVRLREEVLSRATFCFGDSHLGPKDFALIDVFEPVLAALLVATADTGVSLGVAGMDTTTLVQALMRRREHAADSPTSAEAGRALDDYIEAQIHGDVDLNHDVEAMVIDPSFRDTPTGEILERIARRHGFALHWHAGFELPVDQVDPHFRGPAIPVLAERIHRQFAQAGRPIDAALIGKAAACVVSDPTRWEDWGTVEVTLQHLKQLWHVLVRFGRPRTEP
jgi:hypothetical protein